MGTDVQSPESFTLAEISAVTGEPVRAVYKAIAERLPRTLPMKRGGQHALTRWEAVCFVIDRQLPKDVPVAVRRTLYAAILGHQSDAPVHHKVGVLSYAVDVKAAADRLASDLDRYQAAMALIVEDELIQAGAATFRGTRILVHQIAELLSIGVEASELMTDYPRLTAEMLAAAPVFARSHPRRGRPRTPPWRDVSAERVAPPTGE